MSEYQLLSLLNTSKPIKNKIFRSKRLFLFKPKPIKKENSNNDKALTSIRNIFR